MAALQSLLAPEDHTSSGQDRASALTDKISTASSALTFIPTLHPLALEVVANGLLYQCSLVDLSTPQSPPDNQLGVALRAVWSLLNSLLKHCPLGWSTRLFKVPEILLFSYSLSLSFSLSLSLVVCNSPWSSLSQLPQSSWSGGGAEDVAHLPRSVTSLACRPPEKIRKGLVKPLYQSRSLLQNLEERTCSVLLT